MIGVVVVWHTLWHLIRWGLQEDNLNLFLFHHVTGITGFISLVITPLLVWPMRLSVLRRKISFEVRKRVHYLSWVWAVAICFHAPPQHIFWIIGTAFLIYLLDWIYGIFGATHMAPSARFVRLESAVMVRILKPDSFKMKGSGGYCYLCIPWISKYEWHAFSAFKDPFDDSYVCFCIALAGDWTRNLHATVNEPIHRRIWMYGPFPSPFDTACKNDQVLTIASGIGITPALSVVQALADTRKMHLVWICRDASLLEFVLDYGAQFDDDAYTLVFYTGKREPVFKRNLPYNVFLLKGRPDLEHLVPSLISAAQSDNKQLLDLSAYEELYDHGQDEESAQSLEKKFYAEINRLLLTYSVNELFNAAVRRSRVSNRRVTFEGLEDLVANTFTRQFSDKQLRALFDLVDADGGGSIDFREFGDFISHMEAESKKFTRTATTDVDKSRDSAIDLGISTNDSKAAITTVDNPQQWRLMYCGGSAQVGTALNKVSVMHQIPLSLESFEW